MRARGLRGSFFSGFLTGVDTTFGALIAAGAFCFWGVILFEPAGIDDADAVDAPFWDFRRSGGGEISRRATNVDFDVCVEVALLSIAFCVVMVGFKVRSEGGGSAIGVVLLSS